ncbi:MAG: Alpha/beta hydrolase fold protein [Candidatus Curtissbacteria bacterium GW2011_GWC2_38_9]|uniref:AB hydrolase-1 domain-containing protein n=2 Tax=Candidatus Curtissiibacteriota TaxID=1752717 RepID=A0A1F5HRI1_9BACT|nr:MAG: Alpha/beta hydrolase fold protein [Candidatus Curtissbacteria bacterium GW2011_GWC2_38_9]OGD88499.1 MAG: hypothetical protein A2Z54_02450 [Candidatus Curtissbacteria bacterium RIFCSPHIGHO2_02_39_8]OGE06747.1 MAG: hypothetical protein A2W70_04835 [Candidatus Curtissbacteria bacterium RIFCSPLOWO2_02_41_11]
METGELNAPSFKQQFKSREELHFPEGKITVVDVVPRVLSDETPVLLVPGWSENYDTYKKTLAVGFNEGRRIVTVGQSGNGQSPESQEYPEEELRKAQLLLNVLGKKGIEKADVIAHSEGAINGLIAAIMKPYQFRNIVLDKPAGFIGKDTKAALTGRFIKLLLQEIIARPILLTDSTSSIRAGARTARYIAENPQRVLKEMDALTSVDITEIMTSLSNQGIKFSVIAGVNDPLFPVSRQIADMREHGNVPPLKGYYSVIGGHNKLSIDASRHASLAFNALENLRDLKDSS